MSHPKNSGSAVHNLREALKQHADSKPASSTLQKDSVGLFQRAGSQALAIYQRQKRGGK